MEYLIASFNDQTVKIISLADFNIVQVINFPVAIDSLDISEDEKWLVVAGCRCGTIFTVSLVDYSIQNIFRAHNLDINHVKLRGDKLITSSLDNTAKLWKINLAKKELLMEFIGHIAWVRKSIFSPRGDKILTGSQDYTMKLWLIEPLAQSYCCQTFSGHYSPILDMAFVREDLIISISTESHLRVWDTHQSQAIKIIDMITQLSTLTISQNRLLVGYRSGDIRLYQGRKLPYADYLEFDFYGSNFAIMSDWFRAATKLFFYAVIDSDNREEY